MVIEYMQTTKSKIQVIKNDINTYVDLSSLSNVIFIEDSEYHHMISQITLTGKYNRVYDVVSFVDYLDSNKVCIDSDTLLIALFEEVAVVDLQQDKLAGVIKFDNCWGIRNICKLKSEYFIHCEGVNYFIDKNSDILWKSSSLDIFVNIKVEKDFESCEDYVVVFDWYGHKHYYNEGGEFKCEYFPQFNCN